MRKLIFLLLFSQILFSQKNVSLEEKIYNEIEAFAANPNQKGLQKLEVLEKSIHAKTQSEIVAFFSLEYNLGYYQNQFGNTQKAIYCYENAWRIYQKNKLTKYEIIDNCLRPLGNLYTIIGDYDNAENTIKNYFYIATVQNNLEQKSAAILNLSNVYQNTGRINEAIDLLEKTIKTEKLSCIQKGILMNNLGSNYLLISGFSVKSNYFLKAKKAFQTAIQLLKSDKNQSKTCSNSYRNLAQIYSAEGQMDLANEAMNIAIQKFFEIPNGTPREQAKLYYEIALLDFRQDNFSEAAINLKAIFKVLLPSYSNSKTILPSKQSLYAETTLLDALDLQAQLFLAQNQPKKALESYSLSFYIEELFQSLLVYENSKIITQIRNRNRTEKCIAIYYSLYQKEKKIGYIESAFALQEKSKSAVLQQEISRNKTISREEKLILEQLQNWNNVIVKEQQKLDYADISVINSAIKKENELMLLLKSKQSKTENQSQKELSLADLYSKLEKDKAIMVEYFVGSEKLYSFTIENHTIKIQEFDETFKEDSVFYGFLNYFKDADAISNNPKEYNQVANTVFNFLKLPNNKLNKNLIIVPDGILTFLPFEALITKQSNTTNFAKMHYLLKDFSVGYSNSASFYLNAIPFKHEKENVLGVFPVFENSPLELSFSVKELDNLKSNFDGNYLDRKNATFTNFKLNAANYSILHLSTHASSGDIFEPASIKFRDQDVFYSEFYHLNIQPNLVVLSACETGLGKLYKSEGAMSVARGFQFAGAQNLLFSLWKVNDYTTSVLMGKFYKNVKKGDSYFDANHKAKLSFLSDFTIPSAKKSPYYWSAFVYYGTMENKPSTHYLLWILIIGGIIGLLFFIKFFFHRK